MSSSSLENGINIGSLTRLNANITPLKHCKTIDKIINKPNRLTDLTLVVCKFTQNKFFMKKITQAMLFFIEGNTFNKKILKCKCKLIID